MRTVSAGKGIKKEKKIRELLTTLSDRCTSNNRAKKNRKKQYTYYDLFNCGRICKYCGINMDTTDLESLEFFHKTCWEEYRKNKEVYPFPENFGDC